MRKETKSKRNKVPKIGEKEYAAYIDFLKNEGEIHSVEQVTPTLKNQSIQKSQVKSS